MATTETVPALATARLPFSLSQNEVWLDQASWPDSPHLNIGGGAFLEGTFDLACFREALRLLVAENEALRLAPLPEGGQRLLDVYNPILNIVDCSTAEDPRTAMRDWWNQDMHRPFPLDGTPPWKFTLLRGGENLHGLTIRFHHVVMDGWGTVLVMRRWSEIHNALATGNTPPPHAGRSYQAAIAESLAYRDSPAYASDADYWRSQLPSLPLPLIERRWRPASADQLPVAHVCTQRIPRDGYTRLTRFAAAHGVTPFTVLLAALAIYFARIGNRCDIVIGVPHLNRTGKRHNHTLGMFVGVVPLVLDIDPGLPLDTLLTGIGNQLRSALRHPRYPLSALGRDLQMIRQGRDTLCDVLLSFERQDYALHFGDARLCDSRQLFSGLARYPLGVTVCEFHPGDDLELILEASAACFDADHAGLIGHRLWWLLENMLARPNPTVTELDLLPASERRTLLDGQQPFPLAASQATRQPFICRFAQQAAEQPHANALVWDGGAMDYGDLDRRTSQLAARLRRLGVNRNTVVAFAFERSPEMILALLAIARAGAAFLPLDSDAPRERLRDLLDDSRAVALLIPAEQHPRLGHLHSQTLVVDMAMTAGTAPPSASWSPPAPEDLAYVLFTSGSTGRPKGVMIEHAALSQRLAWLSETYGIGPEDRSALATQITFDPALIELCLPLIHGASIALPPPGRLLPETLAAFAARHAVSFIAFVPATLHRFTQAAAHCPDLRLRVACCGGEVLPPEVARQFMRATNARLFNVYGPTETAIFATAWPCTGEDLGTPLPVGRPIAGTQVYILDPQLRPLPFYETGEIYLGGVVARGYLNRPDLDREAFLDNPFPPGGRLYRTGDLGWLNTTGTLHFVGRRDRQIKLRGYRIEPGEIEAALLACDGVRQAAVKRVTLDGKDALHAWVAMPAGGSVAAVQEQLRRRLPDYMLPAALLALPALPESQTGKIDYSRLPTQRPAAARQPARAPHGPFERTLLSLWEQALARQPLRVTDNFFDCGGDSLAAIEILSGIHRLTGRRVPLYLLTENPTVEALAAVLSAQTTGENLLLPLGAGNGGPALFLAASGHGDYNRFSNLARVLAPPVTLHMLQPPGTGEFRTMPELAARYAEKILAQGSAPDFIAGFSVAGIAALETCRLLRLQGQPVHGLILIDTVYPGRFFRAARLWRLGNWLVRLFCLQDLRFNGRRLGTMFSDAGLVAQVRAIAGYRPKPLDIPVALIKSTGLLPWDRWAFRRWRPLFGERLREYTIAGMHGSVFAVEHVERLANTLRQAMRDIDDIADDHAER